MLKGILLKHVYNDSYWRKHLNKLYIKETYLEKNKKTKQNKKEVYSFYCIFCVCIINFKSIISHIIRHVHTWTTSVITRIF